MSRIAISYRRSDSSAIAGRIADRLAATYGRADVFIDVDSVPLGTDFRRHVQEVWAQIAVLLVVIGPDWLAIDPQTKVGRIHKQSDPVRVEVETALNRDIPVIPVLVNGAAMPGPDQLPRSLRPFAYRNAAEVDDGRDFHTAPRSRLTRAIDAIVGRNPVGQDSPATGPLATTGIAADPTQGNTRPRPAARSLSLLRDMVVAVLMLVALQYLIVNVFDLDTAYLRIASFAAPFALGAVSGWQNERDVFAALTLAAGVGLVAVAAMAILTGLSSGQRILPAGPFEWRESIEYVVSMTASFFAGSMITRLKPAMPWIGG